MSYTAAIITVSDKGFAGERVDKSGPAVREILERDGWVILSETTVPDDFERIKAELVRCSYALNACLIITTGGTGFSRRDVTPEATEAVINRVVPGIPEAMRAASTKLTPRGMLSRGTAGLRGETLIVNLPGSETAARENLEAVTAALKHGVDMLRGTKSDCAEAFSNG
ncbi:MAG: MogA/MoaB family molybdenum cofactor biosynthesis protein [Oscillospiraceae bacterium]